MKKRIFILGCLVFTVIVSAIYWNKRQENIRQEKTLRWRKFQDKQFIAQHAKQMFPLDSRQVFNASKRMTLYALDSDSEGYQGKNAFHGYKVLDSSRIKPKLAKELRSAFYKNVAQKSIPALCFFPHHGIRATHNGKTLDFVICFACGQIVTYYGGEETGTPFSASERETFNAIYKKAGLQIKDDWP